VAGGWPMQRSSLRDRHAAEFDARLRSAGFFYIGLRRPRRSQPIPISAEPRSASEAGSATAPRCPCPTGMRGSSAVSAAAGESISSCYWRAALISQSHADAWPGPRLLR
jgi:hypothetical protein